MLANTQYPHRHAKAGAVKWRLTIIGQSRWNSGLGSFEPRDCCKLQWLRTDTKPFPLSSVLVPQCCQRLSSRPCAAESNEIWCFNARPAPKKTHVFFSWSLYRSQNHPRKAHIVCSWYDIGGQLCTNIVISIETQPEHCRKSFWKKTLAPDFNALPLSTTDCACEGNMQKCSYNINSLQDTFYKTKTSYWKSGIVEHGLKSQTLLEKTSSSLSFLRHASEFISDLPLQALHSPSHVRGIVNALIFKKSILQRYVNASSKLTRGLTDWWWVRLLALTQKENHRKCMNRFKK